MDRNSITGFVLLILLGAGYIFWSSHQQKALLAQQQADSVAQAQKVALQPNSDSLTKLSSDTALLTANTTDSGQAVDSVFHGTVSYPQLTNDLLDLKFSTKGGYPVTATVKKYNNYFGGVVKYFDGDKDNQLSFDIPFDGKTISTKDLYFTPTQSTVGDTAQQLTFTADLGQGKKVILLYILSNNSYMMNAGFRLVGFGSELAGVKDIPMTWTTTALRTEKDMDNERYYMQAHLKYTDGDFDYFPLKQKKEKSLKKPIKWFSVRSHFFNSTLIADNEFSSNADYKAKMDEADDSVAIVTDVNNFALPVANAGSDYNFGFRWLISPNDYHLFRSYNIGLDEIISLGYGPFFFVKYISKWVIIPLFDFIIGMVSNIGISIILLILVIRVFLSFFTYKSYLSNAKMKALKPELEDLRAKFGKNQQQMGMEQMKLYRTAGVNPLGGCLPMLLQMPFLLAVYYFIPTALELRQVPFLWAEDLSTWDSIANLGFKIPIYGSHVSLFTLLMAGTSLFLALYNKNMMGGGAAAPAGGTGAEMQKMMKYMPYFMPFMFLGWFNSMAAGLTLYYTCSNLISMGQQFVIQKYFINEDDIHAKIQERKKQPKGKGGAISKWQQRLEEMQKTQQERLKKR